MKPLQVEFSAFGSYPGVVTVDFTRLAARGLFVVTGDTGTGKTTIFDAMSYALFGEMPSKDGNDIRSHHAPDEASTYARFRFELDGDEYVAERSPEYERPKQRGSGTTKQPATVLLQRIAADGTTEPLATKSREMDARVGDLIGLTAEQFRRVMLLPQGEVARFLLDDSKDREQLLSALFDGGVYERVTRRLLDEASALAQQVGGVDEELRHHVRTAATAIGQLYDTLAIDEPDGLTAADASADVASSTEMLAVTAGPIAELADEEAIALDVATRTETEHTQAADAARRFDDAADLARSISTELSAEPAVAAAAAAADRSKAARPIAEAAEAHRRASDAAGQAEVALGDQLAQITATGDGLVLDTGSPTVLLQRIGELRTDLADERRRHGEHEAAVAAVAAAVEARDRNAAEVRAAEEQCVVLAAEADRLGAEVAALAARQVDVTALDAAHERLLAAKRLLAERDRSVALSDRRRAAAAEADRRFEELLARYVATEAPRLAARLVDGEPCPVCGSADHPAPAVDDGGEAVDTDAVEAARQQRQTAQQAWTSAAQDLDDVRVRLGALADADEAVVDAEIAENRGEHAVARRLADELQEVTARHERVGNDLRTATTTRDQLVGAAPMLRAAVREAEGRLADTGATVVGIDPASFDRRGTRLDEVARLAAGVDELQRTVIATATQADSARRTLEDALAASEFETVDDALAVLLDPTQEAGAIEALRLLRSRLETARAKLEVLEQQGVPSERPEVEALRLAAAESRQRANALSDRRLRATDRRDAAVQALERHARTGAASADLRARAAAARRAADVCHGTVGTKVSLRRWVLGRELERVAVVASEHLRAMTNGRYTIRRVDVGGDKRRAKGLDLEVLDAHTGRPRRPNSLSGGEQFQASLALALGLADVVSHGGTASGRRIEALFIDEGFGSLDPRALDDAIETLHQLHASGRMVGAITHVEAMKERLHPGIVVTRLPDGRGSTLTVNP